MNQTYGKVFISKSGSAYGVIRKAVAPYPKELSSSNVLAEDESGNYFLTENEIIYFWDHETSESEVLAKSLQCFISGCSIPKEVELNPEQVESAWIAPEFAKKFGVEPKP